MHPQAFSKAVMNAHFLHNFSCLFHSKCVSSMSMTDVASIYVPFLPVLCSLLRVVISSYKPVPFMQYVGYYILLCTLFYIQWCTHDGNLFNRNTCTSTCTRYYMKAPKVLRLMVKT